MGSVGLCVAWVRGLVGNVGQILAWGAWVAWVHKILVWVKRKAWAEWVKILARVVWCFVKKVFLKFRKI